MKAKTYSIFGAGAAGLYTAWRLLTGKPKNAKKAAKLLSTGDTLELYDWGKYDFSKKNSGTREPGARVCTWHYQDDKKKSYLELGGMRYAEYSKATNSGHLLVTTVIQLLELDRYSRNFDATVNQLLYLRGRNIFLSDISKTNPAPYNIPGGGATKSPYDGFTVAADVAVTKTYPSTRKEWCAFNKTGAIIKPQPKSSVFQKGDKVADIGYWNLMYDRLGGEGYQYTADANGYTSNVINWNSAVAFNTNNEFAPGNQYKTLTLGYSAMFTALFAALEKAARKSGVNFKYHPDTRLHSILHNKGVVHFKTSTRRDPWHPAGENTCDAAWLAMPRNSIELVAQATAYQLNDGLDVLNDQKVKLYLEAAVMQPSYKIGLFFKQPWWEKATYPPNLKTPGKLDSIGPSFTDTPIRMAVYFGNNALNQSGEKVYGMLASYDDEQYTTFWRELEEGVQEDWTIPVADDIQPLIGPRKASSAMVQMLRKQLAEMHFGPGADPALVPEPLEARYMDWSLPPFNAGYHAWAAHYNICDVMQKIRKPSQLIKGADANIFIVGEAYSNDQAWVEGAFCTSESVLNDFVDMEPIVDNPSYPFICA